jgi:hypothetical protein
MTQIFPQIRSITDEESQHYGLANPGLMLNHDTATYKLSAGTTDTIYIFKNSVVIYVLTINHHLEYCALEAFIGTEDEAIESIFLQGSALEECIGNNWYSLPLATLATKLIQLFT